MVQFEQFLILFTAFVATCGVAGLSIRAPPATALNETFTIGFFLPYCDNDKSIVRLETFDEFDAPAFEGDISITTTFLRDFRNADGSQIKGIKHSCKFGEIPFTQIPFEPRRYTITVDDDGHSQKMQECSLKFDTDPGISKIDLLVDLEYFIGGDHGMNVGLWDLRCRGDNFRDVWPE